MIRFCKALDCDNEAEIGSLYCSTYCRDRDGNNAPRVELNKREAEARKRLSMLEGKKESRIDKLLSLCRKGIELSDKRAEAWNQGKVHGIDADEVSRPREVEYTQWLMKHGHFIMDEILKLREA